MVVMFYLLVMQQIHYKNMIHHLMVVYKVILDRILIVKNMYVKLNSDKHIVVVVHDDDDVQDDHFDNHLLLNIEITFDMVIMILYDRQILYIYRYFSVMDRLYTDDYNNNKNLKKMK